MFDNLLRGPLLSQTKPTGDATCLLFLIRPNAAIFHWSVIFKATTSIVILIWYSVSSRMCLRRRLQTSLPYKNKAPPSGLSQLNWDSSSSFMSTSWTIINAANTVIQFIGSTWKHTSQSTLNRLKVTRDSGQGLPHQLSIILQSRGHVSLEEIPSFFLSTILWVRKQLPLLIDQKDTKPHSCSRALNGCLRWVTN